LHDPFCIVLMISYVRPLNLQKLLLHRLHPQSVCFLWGTFKIRVGANCVRPCHIAETRRANAVRPYIIIVFECINRLRQQEIIAKVFWSSKNLFYKKGSWPSETPPRERRRRQKNLHIAQNPTGEHSSPYIIIVFECINRLRMQAIIIKIFGFLNLFIKRFKPPEATGGKKYFAREGFSP